MFRYWLLEHQALVISWLSEGATTKKTQPDAVGMQCVGRNKLDVSNVPAK
jgi:hypothetical protein